LKPLTLILINNKKNKQKTLSLILTTRFQTALLFQLLPPDLRGFNGQWAHYQAAHDSIQDKCALDQKSSIPAKVLGERAIGWAENKGAHACAADGDAYGKGAPLLEVVAHGDDGGHVDEAEAKADDEADGDVEVPDGGGKVAEDEAEAGNQAADNCGEATAELVGEHGGDGARGKRDRWQQSMYYTYENEVDLKWYTLYK
jgi:hypothetical protein